MELKLFTLLPEKAKEFFDFATSGLGLPAEEAFKLYHLTLRTKFLSDTPLYNFLERALCGFKLDEVGKREYLLTFSVHTLRELLKEHLDLKLTKNLYQFLRDKLPSEFFKGCAPKREVLVSQDVTFELLGSEKKLTFPPYIKVRHFIVPLHLKGSCDELIILLSEITLYALRRVKEGLYEAYLPLSISEIVYYLQRLVEKKFLKKIESEALLNQLKSLFPDCFGEF